MLESFDDLHGRLAADDRVRGVVLTGSHARAGMATARSDHDLLLIVADGAERDLASESRRDAVLDVTVMPWKAFAEHALPGSPDEWARYSFAHCKILKDDAAGHVAALAAEKATVSEMEAGRVLPGALDHFLNAVYRSVKNDRDGDALAARMDAAESMGGYLTYIFALHHRVRPYNKYLTWELVHYPLSRPEWFADRLMPVLNSVLSVEAVPSAQRLLIDLEPVARAAGHGPVLDGWGDDLALMRDMRSG